MFTGIIEEMGVVESIDQKENLVTLTLKAEKILSQLKLGESIAIDGVCLTVTEINDSRISFDIMKETLDVTTLGRLEVGRKLNLERALSLGSRLNGHFVSGHVDFMATIGDIISDNNYVEICVEMKEEYRRYIVPKGSITIDGVSLTVGKVNKNFFSVYLIPVTLQETTLGERKKGQPINIEIDLLARYVLQQTENK